jgi:hypothetical protein
MTPAEVQPAVIATIPEIYPPGYTPTNATITAITAAVTAAGPQLGWVGGAMQNMIAELLEQDLSLQEFAAGGAGGAIDFGGLLASALYPIPRSGVLGPYPTAVQFALLAPDQAGIGPVGPYPIGTAQHQGTAGDVAAVSGDVASALYVSVGVFDVTLTSAYLTPIGESRVGEIVMLATLAYGDIGFIACSQTGQSTVRISTFDIAGLPAGYGWGAVFFVR